MPYLKQPMKMLIRPLNLSEYFQREIVQVYTGVCNDIKHTGNEIFFKKVFLLSKYNPSNKPSRKWILRIWNI